MKKALILSVFLSVLFNGVIFASSSICSEFAGFWEGEWLSLAHVVNATTIDIRQTDEAKFNGVYWMDDGQTDNFFVSCKSISEDEASLDFSNSVVPTLNPCRGSLIRVNTKLVLHLYCFNPNNSGYFIKT